MTAPDGGGHLVAVKAAAPIMLTEYVSSDQPARVINSDPSAARVYLGADSSVSPSNGVPLDPGTSLPWAAPGQLWAIADPTAAGPVTITLTTAVDDWQPSPAAIAAQVAAKLLAQGVPNVLTEAVLYTGTLADGAQTSLDVSGYASVIIELSPQPLLSTATLQWTLLGAAGFVESDIVCVPASTTYVPRTSQGCQRIEVSGSTLLLANITGGGKSLKVTVSGSNRAPGARVDSRYNTAFGDHWTLASTAMAAAGVYPLNQADPVQLQGLAWLSCYLTGSTVTGRFEMTVFQDGATRLIILADTADMTGTGTRKLTGLVALPAAPYAFQFRSVAAGTTTCDLSLVPAQI